MQQLPTHHPLRHADWIWPETYRELHNHFAQFRWDFNLEAVSETVPFAITADKAYKLYVNGVFVCRGPARGYQAHWPYDEVDLAAYLHGGKNWISVEAYQPGCSTFQYLHMNYAGLLVATEDEALREAMGQPVMRRSPGHRRDTARLSMQIDYQESLDLRLDDRTWITSSEPPVGWKDTIYPPAAQVLNSIPFGRPPYQTVEPRGIPLLGENLCAPTLPTSHAVGNCDPGYESPVNLSWHWVEEGKKVAEWMGADDLDCHIEGDYLALTIPATGTGKFHAIVLSPGEYSLGMVDVKAEGALGGEILDFQHDQFFRDGKPHFLEPGEGCSVALCNRLILREGTCGHEFYHPFGFGALTIVARDLIQPLTLKLRVRHVGYPFSMRGQFSSSDTNLNEIYSICRRSQRICALDAYMDTPWREQAQWWGDARVQGRNTFYLDGDARLLERGIRSLAGQSFYGLTPGHAPTSSYWCILPDFSLTWIITLWDHFWQTGDPTLFQEMLPRAKEVLSYFDTPEARHESGLLQSDRRFWLFEDWANLPKQGIPTFLNLWYVVALRCLDRLCLEADVEREGFGERANAHLELVKTHLWNASERWFWPVADLDGNPHGEPSVHDQTLALMLGAVPEAEGNLMEGFVLPYLRGEPLPGATPSSFWSTYTLEQAILRGHSAEALAFIKRMWTPMLSTGTTWEEFRWHEESGLSACHAWSAHPSFHFVNSLAGIIQGAPGWKTVRFNPVFVDGIDHIEATVPAPVGDIMVAWERVGNTVKGWLHVPEGVVVAAMVPVQSDGSFEVTLPG